VAHRVEHADRDRAAEDRVKKSRNPAWLDAYDALLFVGRLDAWQAALCRFAYTADMMLGEAQFLQKHIDAERKSAIAKLKKALSPIPFTTLPADLQWIRGHADPPCYISRPDREALFALIGPSLFGPEEPSLFDVEEAPSAWLLPKPPSAVGAMTDSDLFDAEEER
jgi:hypothetical protein